MSRAYVKRHSEEATLLDVARLIRLNWFYTLDSKGRPHITQLYPLPGDEAFKPKLMEKTAEQIAEEKKLDEMMPINEYLKQQAIKKANG